MTTQRLLEVHHAMPFRPYTIYMGDGRSFYVKHPDFLSRSPSGRTVVVHTPDDRMSILDLLLMTEIEVGEKKPPRRKAKRQDA